MSRHKSHLDPETGAPFYPLSHAQDAARCPKCGWNGGGIRDEGCMVAPCPRLPAQDERAKSRMAIAEIIGGKIFNDIPGVIPGAATRYAREDALKKADAILALRSPAGCAAPTIDDIPSCGQENDYRRARPTPAASEGPTLEDLHYKAEQENQRLREIVNTQADMLRDLRNEVNQALSQVEEASGLIHDLLGLELGSSERAMAWLDSRSDTSTNGEPK